MKLNAVSRKMFIYACCCALGLFVLQFSGLCHAMEIEINVSPNTLNLQSSGEVCTVHTNIDYEEVSGASVYLNGIAIYYWKSDNQGNFVAKFILDEIKNLPLNIDEDNLLQLVGVTVDGEPFVGSQEIMVVDHMQEGRDK